MILQEAIEHYLKKVKLRCRERTYDYYYSHLNNILNYFNSQDVYTVGNVNNELIYKFINYQKKKKLSNRTINKRITAFKQVLKYNDLYFISLDKIENLRVEHKTYSMFNESELKKIMNYMYKLPTDNYNLTFKLFIMLSFDTGVRINELLNIERKNINMDQQSILLTTTKTGVERYCYFTEFTKILLVEYINISVDHNYLFHNFKRNERLTYRTVRCFIDRMKLETKINKITPHMFRHTFATLLVDNGADVYSVMRLLGHTSVRTTEIYLHNNQKKNLENYNKYHEDINKYLN